MFVVIFYALMSIFMTMLQTGRIFGNGIQYLILSEGLAIALALIAGKKKREMKSSEYYVVVSIVLLSVMGVNIRFELAGQSVNVMSEYKRIWHDCIIQSLAFAVSYGLWSRISERVMKVLMICAAVFQPIVGILLSQTTPVNGSRIVVFGIVSLAIYSGLIPFTYAFLSSEVFGERKTVFKYRTQMNSLVIAVYFLVNAVLLVYNRDLGTLMIMGVSMLLVLLPSLEKDGSRWIVFGVILAGLVGLYVFSSVFRIRVQELVHPTMAEAKFLYQRACYIGWFGRGYQSISTKVFRNAESDYILTAIINNHGFLPFLIIGMVSALLFTCLQTIQQEMGGCKEERTFTKLAIVVIIFPMLYLWMSTLNLVPVTGIAYPWLSRARSLNAVYSVLVAGVLALHRRNA